MNQNITILSMNKFTVEESYPITFRHKDAEKLGSLLKNRRSVVLVGMKRVGISNFLRFFLYHKDVPTTYIQEKNHIFITIDLNDLVEREVFPFWILTFKRIEDFVETHIADEAIKKRVSELFLNSIQSQDLFLTIEGIRKSLVLLCDAGYSPTLFLLRFDRIIESMSESFLGNLQGLLEATQRQLAFVFTSVRPLESLSPQVFTKSDLSIFADTLYVKPAKDSDVKIIYETLLEKYQLQLSADVEKELLRLVDGYNQYLQFALIALSEHHVPLQAKKLLDLLLSDERIALQSEELWESLTKEEQHILKKMETGEWVPEDLEIGEYLFKTGIITHNHTIFSPLFEHFLREKTHIKKRDNHILELSKKEYLLLSYMRERLHEVCEREEIISAVWPEAEALGVSDWAIDRLIARLRSKLKQQEAKEEIVTVKTRGYKLVENV